jgi:uncharacterized protein
MTANERSEYAKHRVKSAYKTIEAAKLLAEHQHWNSAMNRLYYAAFYAVNALLIANNFQTKSHSGAKTMFSQHFVKSGKFDKKYGRLLSELFDNRQKGDYENIVDFEEDYVESLFKPVQEMIKMIDIEIHKNPIN